MFQSPKNNRNWDNLHREMSEISFDKANPNIVFIKNIRDARYNPNFEFENKVGYENKKYNLDKLSKLWILVSPYDLFQNHVILSFQFSDNFTENSFLTISYEIRKTDLIDFNIYKTFYKNYEGYYLLTTEEDSFYVRTNIRKNERTYLYPLEIEKQKLKNIFSDFLSLIDKQKQTPEFYKIFSRNCLSQIFSVLAREKVLKIRFYNYLAINKYIYKTGLVQNSKNLQFKNFLQKYSINNTAELLPDHNYSFFLRQRNLK